MARAIDWAPYDALKAQGLADREIARRPDGALLLWHVAQAHLSEVGRFLDQMCTTDDITPGIGQAFEEEQAP